MSGFVIPKKNDMNQTSPKPQRRPRSVRLEPVKRTLSLERRPTYLNMERQYESLWSPQTHANTDGTIQNAPAQRNTSTPIKEYNRSPNNTTTRKISSRRLTPETGQNVFNNQRTQTKRRSPPGKIKDNPHLNKVRASLSQKQISQSNFLNSICISSGDCMAFGREKERIPLFFNNMDFKYLDGDAKKIGTDSVNGIVHLLKYTKDNYSTYAVLKSSKNSKADSLLYEYIVGKYFINNYVSKYPCFMETYELYKYNYIKKPTWVSDLLSTLTKDIISREFIRENLTKSSAGRTMNGLKVELKKICMDKTGMFGVKYAVLVEYLNNPISFSDFLKNPNDYVNSLIFINYFKNIFTKKYVRNQDNGMHFFCEIINILLQIYIPLGKLMNSFTHNDLHLKNVLLYKVPGEKYIEMRYEIGDKTVVIKTQYIAKIIDYGRCFFNPENTLQFFEIPSKKNTETGIPRQKYNLNSKGITQLLNKTIEEIEEMEELKPEEDKVNLPINRYNSKKYCNGFSFFGIDPLQYNNYTSISNGNISRDISFILLIYERLKNWKEIIEKAKENNNVNLNVDDVLNRIVEFFEEISLKEILNNASPIKTEDCAEKRACNVEMVRDSIIDFYLNKLSDKQVQYDESSRLGVMKIYDDGRDMLFVKDEKKDIPL